MGGPGSGRGTRVRRYTPRMTFATYEMNIADFAHYPNAGERDAMAVNYCALELNGEAGEAADVIKKAIRDDRFGFEGRCLSPERRQKAALEAGDALFALCRFIHEIGYEVEDIAKMNIAKLDHRYAVKAVEGDEVAQKVVAKRRVRRSRE